MVMLDFNPVNVFPFFLSPYISLLVYDLVLKKKEEVLQCFLRSFFFIARKE